MRISDWSSDVCSSDLPPGAIRAQELAASHNVLELLTDPAGVSGAEILPERQSRYPMGGTGTAFCLDTHLRLPGSAPQQRQTRFTARQGISRLVARRRRSLVPNRLSAVAAFYYA